MKLIVTTVVREAPLAQHGYVYIVDWEKKEVLCRFQPPPPRKNPVGLRGGSRGFRGITFIGDHCYIANHDSIFGYDLNWKLVNTISHPLFCSIHEIEADARCLWVVSTGIDAVLKMSLSGGVIEQHFLGELPEYDRASLGIRKRHIDYAADYREAGLETSLDVAHPNAISLVAGRPYITLYRPGAVVALNPFELVWRDDSYYGVHSGRVLDGGRILYVAASFQSAFLGIDLKSGGETFRVSAFDDSNHNRNWHGQIQKIVRNPAFQRMPTVFLLKHAPQWMRNFLPTARPGWSRGIAVVDDEYIFGGSSSATISLINTRTGRVEQQLQLEDGISHSVYEIAIDKRQS